MADSIADCFIADIPFAIISRSMDAFSRRSPPNGMRVARYSWVIRTISELGVLSSPIRFGGLPSGQRKLRELLAYRRQSRL